MDLNQAAHVARVAGNAGLGIIVNAGSAAASAIGTGIGSVHAYMANRNASRMSAQNEPTSDYEDAIEEFQANVLIRQWAEQEQRDRDAERMMLNVR